MKKPIIKPPRTFLFYDLEAFRRSDSWPLMAQIHERVRTAQALEHRVEVVATKDQLSFVVLDEKP